MWPPNFTQRNTEIEKPNPRKRTYTTFTQKTKSQSAMMMHGMNMNAIHIPKKPQVTDECEKLCDKLLSGNYETPVDSFFKESCFKSVKDAAGFWNEAQVKRHIMPLVVPSATALNIHEIADLKGIIEEMDTQWIKCAAIQGPQPKPDFAAGLGSFAFTPQEIEQLNSSHTSDCPTYVTDAMYFPFLVCEAKSSERAIREAEKQAMRSASIAVRAIVRLYERVS
jgi:hypothetical protein